MIVGEYGNTFERILSGFYPKFRVLPKAHRRLLVDATVQYVFRFRSASAYKKLFENVVGEKTRVIDLRRSLLSDGYVMKNLKLYLYYTHINRKQDPSDVSRAFHVKARDRYLYKALSVETRSHFARLKTEGRNAMTLYGFDQALTGGLASVRDYTRKFVHRKMRFIMTSQSQEVHDIAAHLEIDGMQAVMFFYPNIESNEHLINIMKRTIHNSGINYIDKFTTEKRNRIGKDETGSFIARTMPLHSTSVLAELATVENGTLIDGTREDTLSLRIAVEKLLTKFTDKRQNFLKLLMGHYCENFTQYLKDAGATTLDNDVYWERLSVLEDYVQHVLSFLGIRQSAGDKFVKHLQSVLCDFKEHV